MTEVQAKIAELNALLHGSLPYEIGLFAPNDLEPLEVNARYMRNDTFAQLVANVKRDKGLSSVPLVYAGPDAPKPRILSGNHRVKAQIAAKLETPILCLVIRQQMSAEEQVAIQLSHNALAGADDLQTLKKLYEQVTVIDLKQYSGLDEETIKQLDAIRFEPVSEPRLQFKTSTFLFLPSELAELQAMVAHVEKILGDKDAFLFQVKDYLEFFNLVAGSKEKLKIRNSAAAILELMRAGMRHIDEEAANAAAAGEGGGTHGQAVHSD
jgi:hypothetical protein